MVKKGVQISSKNKPTSKKKIGKTQRVEKSYRKKTQKEYN